LQTGREIWRYRARDYKYGGIYAGPAADSGRVYVGGKNGVLHAVSRDTGRPAWQAELGSSLYGAPALAGERLYQGSYDRNVYALQADSGKILWRAELDDWPQGTPVPVGDMLYVCSRSGMLYALGAADGRIVWQMPLGGEVRHSPSVGRNRIGVVATLDGRLIGVDLDRRRIAWEQKLAGGAFGGPAISDGGTLVVTQDGVVSAWR